MPTEKGRYAARREAAKDREANCTVLGYHASELLSRDYADRKYLGINGPDSSTGGETKLPELAKRSAREIKEILGDRYYMAVDTLGIGVPIPVAPSQMPRVTKKSVNVPDTLPDERPRVRKPKPEYDPTKSAGGRPDGKRRTYMGETSARNCDRWAARAGGGGLYRDWSKQG